MRGLDHFSLIAPFYEKVIRSKISDQLLEYLALEPGQRIFDAAGGTGRLAQFLRGSGRQVVICDTSFKMLLQARNKEGMLIMQAPLEKLPIPDGVFDRILLADALHHVADQRKTLTDLMRVLKPGGRLVIEEPDIHSFWVKAIAFIEKITGMRSHFLKIEEIRALIPAAHARVQHFREDHAIWVIVEKIHL